MAADYKTLQPLEYYKTFLDRKTRPDGRSLLEFRETTLNVRSIGTADGSAIVKCGNTTIICGIKAEIGPPTREEPLKGYIIPNVILPPLCSPMIKSGPPGEAAQSATQFIAELVNNEIIVELGKLCIEPSKWAWVLHADLLCINLDGGLLDACVIALVAALKNLSLPSVTYNQELDKITSNSKKKAFIEGINMPVTSTFAIFENAVMVSDPTREEELLATGTISITMEGDSVAHIYKPGGCSLSEKKINTLIQQAEMKTKSISSLIQEGCSAINAER